MADEQAPPPPDACPTCGRAGEPPRLMVDTLTTTTTTLFTFLDRLRILFGWRLSLRLSHRVLVNRDKPLPPGVTSSMWFWHPWRRNRPQMLKAP